ncbi:hypothetical protein PG994_003439 [Apiospora phragmitis]|uniref:Uncharacterized protein n=1 Tax=Apiospora phragmitis TaxID=2905665 RepID=A0ABR1VY93_9PEZI
MYGDPNRYEEDMKKTRWGGGTIAVHVVWVATEGPAANSSVRGRGNGHEPPTSKTKMSGSRRPLAKKAITLHGGGRVACLEKSITCAVR